MKRPTLIEIIMGGGSLVPPNRRDWNVPYWNTPAAQEFIGAEKVMKTSYEKLMRLEEEIDSAERQRVIAELGDGCEPTDARFARARFESHAWQQAWQEFIAAVTEAQQVENRWREESKQTKE